MYIRSIRKQSLENKSFIKGNKMNKYTSYIIITLGLLVSIVGCNNTNKPLAAQWTLEESIGVAMPELDYASENKIIFHGYFGLFIYDLSERKMINSLDLESIGCDAIQGSNYCEVSVSQDGNTIQLHPMENDKMYIYDVEKNKLIQTDYKPMIEPFKVNLNDNPSGSVSYGTVEFTNGDIGYLECEGSTINELYYIVGNNKYKLFSK